MSVSKQTCAKEQNISNINVLMFEIPGSPKISPPPQKKRKISIIKKEKKCPVGAIFFS